MPRKQPLHRDLEALVMNVSPLAEETLVHEQLKDPEPVQRFFNATKKLPGIREASIMLRKLEGIDLRDLSLPGVFGDLPHAALRRTNGGLKNEFLVTVELRFCQDHTGWVALEFLAWWVRDLSRSGEIVQMRPLALPPVAYGTQLGRTLKCAIEVFLVTDGGIDPLDAKLSRLAESLEENLQDYANAIAKPTQAECKDIDSLRRSAEIDDSSAQYRLALCYANGQGVKKDGRAAFTWFERAAGWGHPDAMLNLGICYEKGDGVEADSVKAFEWFMKSAEAGVPLSMGCVASAYQTGKGVSMDLEKAVEWFRRGAHEGDAPCQAELGKCYELGKGVEVNLAEALCWYETALKNGLEAVQPAIDRVENGMS